MLEVKGLDVAYGPIRALHSASLHVGPGEMVALLGPNGAGKTTTLRAIAGLLRSSGGEIWFDGVRIDGKPSWDVVRFGVALLPEGRELFTDLSVLENLRLGAWLHRKDGGGQTRIDEVMDFFPILRARSKQSAGTLSGGEQQMLGVARALMSRPRLLIVDELSLGLAPLIVNQLFEILHAVNATGTSVVIVEQFVHMALANTTRAYVLSRGRIVLEGPSADLEASPELTAAYLGDDAGAAALEEEASGRPRQRRRTRTQGI
jgi:branched-chain amino acid transport system ATP-binding protein